MRGNRGYTRDTGVTLLREKAVIDELQANRAPNQPTRTKGEQAHQ